jgi:hypothetical protein
MKYIVGHLQIKIFNGIQLVTRLYELTRNNLKLEVCLLGIAGGRHLKADRISQSCFQLIKREISLAQRFKYKRDISNFFIIRKFLAKKTFDT